MLKRINLTLLLLALLATSSVLAHAAGRAHFSLLRPTFATNDREQDGLSGPVRRVKTETAKITVKQGKPVEGARVVLETTTYDNKGNKVDNAYFLAAGGTLTGKETYKYDEKGNMIEMTLLNEDGSLQSKESYSYEFDAVGNWVKMTTSVAVIEGGKLTFEPSEVTYRTIAYYLDETMVAKMSQPAAAAQPQPAPAGNAAATTTTSSPAPANSNAQPGAQLNARANVAAQQPKPPAPAANNPAPKTAANTAAKKNASLAVASLDNSAGAAASLNPTLLGGGSSAPAGGPVVRGDGEAPQRPAARGPLKPVSGGILNGRALHLPVPTYPDNARRARASGMVEVEVVIDLTGKVISAKALKGPNLLQATAEQAAKQARFSPTLLSGQPVRVSGVITYNFNITQ